jgi:hypothetical protein
MFNKPQGEGVWKDKSGVYTGKFNNGEFINGLIKYTDGNTYNGYISQG